MQCFCTKVVVLQLGSKCSKIGLKYPCCPVTYLKNAPQFTFWVIDDRVEGSNSEVQKKFHNKYTGIYNNN